MEHIKGYDIEQIEGTSVTLGNFDGIHLGHRKLISTAKEYALKHALKSVVFTFSPHPMFLLKNKPHSALIMSPEEKKYSIEKSGIDLYIEYPFSLEFASMEPEKFAKEIIFDKLKCKVLVVGENYKFGAKQKGDSNLLKKLGKENGVEVIIVPAVLFENERVSSTRIRNCLINKDIEKANLLLGSPYFILGEVVEGKRLGRKLGFPTLNVLADPVKLFPPDGVYATKTVYCNEIFYGVTNVGYNPTVSGNYKVVETYLFNFHKFVYGEMLKTYFFKWLRDEEKFENIDILQKQLQTDAENALKYFKNNKDVHWMDKF